MSVAKDLKSSENWKSQFATSNLVDSKIDNKIVVLRDVQVMIDRDIAELYEIDTKALKQAVKRNIERFPDSFCFELDKDEFENWRSQFVTSKSDRQGLRYAPYAFTEQGVAMLSAVLRSENFSKIFTALDSSPKKAKEGVFFKGQIKDA